MAMLGKKRTAKPYCLGGEPFPAVWTEFDIVANDSAALWTDAGNLRHRRAGLLSVWIHGYRWASEIVDYSCGPTENYENYEDCEVVLSSFFNHILHRGFALTPSGNLSLCMLPKK